MGCRWFIGDSASEKTNESPYLEFYVSKEYLINVAFNNANLCIYVCITRAYGTKVTSVKFSHFA